MRRANYPLRVLQALTSLPEKSGALVDLMSTLNPDDFASPYKELYEEIIKRYNKGQTYRIVDLSDITFDDENVTRAVQEIIEISDREHYSKESLLEFAEIIKRDSQMRSIKTLGQILTREAEKTAPQIKNLLKAIDDTVMEINKKTIDESVTSKLWLKDVEESNKKLRGKSMLGYATGFPSLDRYSKGLQGGVFWIIGGETSVGKSWFAQKLLVSACDDRAGVMMISLELSSKEMGARLLSMTSGVSIFDVKTGNQENNARYQAAVDFFGHSNFVLNDSCQTLDDVIYVIKSAKRKHGTKVFVVDYLQNIRTPKTDSEYAALNMVCVKLQRLCVTEDVCIVAISQMDRGSLKANDIGIHSYKGSGNIENSADMALVLYRDQDEVGDVVICNIGKNRLLGFGGTFKIKQNPNGEIGEIYDQRH